MKKKRMIFAILFFTLLFLLAAFTILLPAREFSQSENRYLAQAPDFSAQEIQNGSFQEGLSDYLSDQIPFREFWIKVNTTIKKCTGQKEINGVYLGKDHFYFQKFTDESYSSSRMISVFRMMDTFIQRHNVPASVMLVPSPGTVLHDKLPKSAPYYNEEIVYETAKQMLSCPVIDLRADFQAHAADTQLYYRTDHHWTTQGAELAYQKYCSTVNLTPREFALEEVSNNFYGTIHSKLLDSAAKPDSIFAPSNLPQIKITYDNGTTATSPYQKEFLDRKDQYAFFFGGNFGKVVIDTGAASQEKLLIIKDSFANSFVPYLLQDYSQIVMIDLRYFSGNVEDVMKEQGITQLLFLYEDSNFLTDTGILKLYQK